MSAASRIPGVRAPSCATSKGRFLRALPPARRAHEQGPPASRFQSSAAQSEATIASAAPETPDDRVDVDRRLAELRGRQRRAHRPQALDRELRAEHPTQRRASTN
jgi:hypothetical protein